MISSIPNTNLKTAFSYPAANSLVEQKSVHFPIFTEPVSLHTFRLVYGRTRRCESAYLQSEMVRDHSRVYPQMLSCTEY